MIQNKFILALLLLIFPFLGMQAEEQDGNTYKTAERLFHIARSANKNLVCYDINLKNGKMDIQKPLKVYWVNREEHPGEIGELSFFQRKMAYGYKLISSSNKACVCTLTAYSKRKLTITQRGAEYVCLTTINHSEAILQSLYIKASPHNPMNVEYVKLFGTSLSTNQPVTEIIKP